VLTVAKSGATWNNWVAGGPSGKMPEAHYSACVYAVGETGRLLSLNFLVCRCDNSSKPKKWRQARRLSYDPGCAGVADIAANPKLLRSLFHSSLSSLLLSFCL